METNYYVYMLHCKDDTLYTGYTTNLKRRLKMHESGKGAKYTRGRGPFEMVYTEKLDTKTAALQRECEIKKLRRADKIQLIKGQKGDL